MSYFRITGYHPQENYCFIIDSNGRFEKLWQFSSYLISKGLKVIRANSEEDMIDFDMSKIKQDSENLILRASAKGKPEYGTHEIDGIVYKTVIVANRRYIDNRQ